MTTERFGEVLARAGLDLTPRELAETLWLAHHLDDGERPEPTPPEAPPPPPRRRPPDAPAEPPGRRPLGLPAERRVAEPEVAAEPRQPVREHRTTARPVLAPTAPMLGDVPALQRALRPLKRRVPSRAAIVVNEDATAEHIADQRPPLRHWVPVMEPPAERWLGLTIVADTGPSMELWRPLVRELRTAFAQVGAFRDLRLWWLAAGDGRVGLRTSPVGRGPLRDAASLVDPSGRTAVLVLSDCSGAHWWDGTAGRAVHAWARRGPTAILQPLPERLWSRTAAPAEPGTARLARPAAPNTVLGFEPYEGAADPLPGDLPVPVLELSASWLADWARLVSGAGGDGVACEVTQVSEHARPLALPVRAERELTGRDRVRRFQATASREAIELAAHLAVSVPSVPVMRLIQAATATTPQPSHMAEVMLSGLLRPDASHPGLYEFIDDAQRALLEALPRSRSLHTRRLLDRVSAQIESLAGTAAETFRAYLPAAHGTDGTTMGAPIALVSEEAARILDRRTPPVRVAVAPETVAVGAPVAPFYLVCDESASMASEGGIDTVNAALRELHEEISRHPVVAEKTRFGLIGFSNDAHVRLPLSDLGAVTSMPTLTASGATAYGRVFALLRETITRDVAALKAESRRVMRPAVFLLTAGMPTDGYGWTDAYRQLTDPGWASRPHIVAFGINTANTANTAIIRQVATIQGFIADGSLRPAEAISEFVRALTRSVIDSGPSIGPQGGTLSLPQDGVRGFNAIATEHVGEPSTADYRAAMVEWLEFQLARRLPRLAERRPDFDDVFVDRLVEDPTGTSMHLPRALFTAGANVLTVEGPAGVGKSTLLLETARFICREPDDHGRPIVVFRSMDALAALVSRNPQIDLADALAATAPKSRGARVSANWFADHLRGGRCVVLIDDIDRHPELVSRWLVPHCTAYANNDFVLAGRAVHRLMEIAFRLILPPFDREQLKDLTERWFENVVPGGRVGRALVNRLTRARSAEIRSAPALVPLLVQAHEVHGNVPDDRVGMYSVLCETNLSSRSILIDPVAQVVDSRRGRRVLGKLALEMLAGKLSHVPVRMAADLVADEMETTGESHLVARGYLSSIADESCLIREDEVGNLAFTHHSLRDYLASTMFVEGAGSEPLLDHVGDPEWHGTILFYAEHATVNALIEADVNALRTACTDDGGPEALALLDELSRLSPVPPIHPFINAQRRQEADDLLMRRVRQGDSETLGTLIQQHAATLHHTALELLGDEQEAEDAVQDTALNAVRQVGRWEPGTPVTSWLSAILVDVCGDRLQRRWAGRPESMRPHDNVIGLANTFEGPSSSEEPDTSLDVQAALQRLTHEERTAVVLVHMMGYSPEDAASVLGIRPRRLRSRIKSAHNRLGPLLEHLRNTLRDP
ncbi:sigma-70 family RNA polymerase sigma factor [Thermomonospora umbrina]|uniref:RNA polymerase sigma factor (Sigma-70 family) n=1 Tax=Thermomonospora umbrina TaxID=111806 RepID=A0A3D9SNK9_9ACTN|nr:sigma-70 family RNA polymerase sigma factor [Thermomonospora umbrina]REE97468.1 RNA polymerase sigma factor (sigma-70 family) [Thermomonospora umbrina]